MPIAVPFGAKPSLTQSSRFRNIAGVPITLPTNPQNLYFYDYLGIWHESFGSTGITPDVGDVLHIDSDVFEGDFIINKIICTSSLTGGSPATSYTQFKFSTSGFIGTFSIYVGSTPLVGTISINSASYSSNLNFLQEMANIINTGSSFSAFVSVGPPLNITLTSPIGSSWNGISPTINFINGGSSYGITNTYPSAFSGGTDPVPGSQSCFMYFYTDFNQNILNNIPQSQTGFEVRDLNKYPLTPSSDSENYFVDNFNNHYI